MKSISPYLLFPGNTEKVFDFYKSVFDGEILALQRFKDGPDADKLPDQIKDKIMHISMSLGNGITLMATDDLQIKPGNNIKVSIIMDSKEEADKVFKKLAVGGNITLPLQDMPWGDYFGMLTDKYDIQWIISHPKN